MYQEEQTSSGGVEFISFQMVTVNHFVFV